MVKPVLSVRNLNVELRSGGDWRPILSNVDFDINPRETVAMVGESGSGKSVTAMSIMQLLPREVSRMSGSISLDGRELLGLDKHRISNIRGNEIAMIFQEPMTSLNPVMRVGEQIAEALRRHRGLTGSAAGKEAVRLLDRVAIPSASTRVLDYPHNFSGGMRQRVMIAMALACKPRLLIADEPTTALDVTIQSQILALLHSLQDEDGMSILFITHDMGVVAEIADRTIVVLNGQLVETGETVSVFGSPSHPYTKRLLSLTPRLGSMAGTRSPKPFDLESSDKPVPTQQTESIHEVDDGDIILDVSHLSKRFPIRRGLFGRLTGNVHAVEDVSFRIRRGETLSLVGESGSGKSTTGRTLLGLIGASSGQVMFDGKDVLGASRHELQAMRKGMQIIFQDPFASLNPRLSIAEAIGEPIRVHEGESGRKLIERVAHLLDLVGLKPDMMRRFPHEFSGGQRQRISIARCLGLNPKLIVADEAVSALDASVKAQIVNLLLELQSRLGLAYLFISHDMAVVERVSHQVAVMYMGEIVEIGPRQEVFGNPQHPYTMRLLSAAPQPDPSRPRRAPLLAEMELKSPIRPLGYVSPVREYRTPSEGHLVQI